MGPGRGLGRGRPHARRASSRAPAPARAALDRLLQRVRAAPGLGLEPPARGRGVAPLLRWLGRELAAAVARVAREPLAWAAALVLALGPRARPRPGAPAPAAGASAPRRGGRPASCAPSCWRSSGRGPPPAGPGPAGPGAPRARAGRSPIGRARRRGLLPGPVRRRPPGGRRAPAAAGRTSNPARPAFVDVCKRRRFDHEAWLPRRGWPVSAGLLLTGCIGGSFGTPFQKTVDESRPLAANGEFELENTNGSVRLTTWDEPRVRIEAVKHAGSERALEELKVEIMGEGDRLSVRTRYPRPHWMGGAGRVDYRVSVPRGARVRVGNVNGRVEVDGRRGRPEGGDRQRLGGRHRRGRAVEASAVNGSVEVEMARVDPAGRSRLGTTNGSVRLTLPRDASAEVEAHTVNGSVGCDFDLADSRKSRRKIEGRIGTGGARFELGTVNGSASIDRGLSARASSPPAEAPTRQTPARAPRATRTSET